MKKGPVIYTKASLIKKLKEIDAARGEGFGEKIVAKLLGISTKKMKGKE